MWCLKQFSSLLLLSCWVWCSQAKEQPEIHIITEQDVNGSLESDTKFVESLRREAKRQKVKSPNVHIENIYIPHQIQRGDETVPDYPSYPVYTYPLSNHANTQIVESTYKQTNAQKPTKSKSSPTGTQLPDKYGYKISQIPRQPAIIYGQTYPEQGNAYFPLPSSAIISPHPQIFSAQSPQGYPYYVIINSPHALQGQLATSMSQFTFEENGTDDEDEDSASDAIPPKFKKAFQLRSPRPQLRLSKSDDDMGLSLAKYLLAHPMYSANDMERSSQRNKEMLAIADDEDGDDVEEDEDEFDDDEDISGKYAGNIDRIVKDDNDCDEFKKIGNLINRRQHSTKRNKLPLDFLFGPNRPSGKTDERVALLFLRHSKRGRQLELADN